MSAPRGVGRGRVGGGLVHDGLLGPRPPANMLQRFLHHQRPHPTTTKPTSSTLRQPTPPTPTTVPTLNPKTAPQGWTETGRGRGAIGGVGRGSDSLGLSSTQTSLHLHTLRNHQCQIPSVDKDLGKIFSPPIPQPFPFQHHHNTMQPPSWNSVVFRSESSSLHHNAVCKKDYPHNADRRKDDPHKLVHRKEGVEEETLASSPMDTTLVHINNYPPSTPMDELMKVFDDLSPLRVEEVTTPGHVETRAVMYFPNPTLARMAQELKSGMFYKNRELRVVCGLKKSRVSSGSVTPQSQHMAGHVPDQIPTHEDDARILKISQQLAAYRFVSNS